MSDWDLLHLPFSRVTLSESLRGRQVGTKSRFPTRCPECAQKCQRPRLNLVDSLRAVCGAGRLIRVYNDQSGVAELVHGLSPDRLAGVRLVGLAIVLGEKLHHGSYAHQWFRGAFPRTGWFEAEQGQKGEGGPLVLLGSRQSQGLQY